MRIKFAATLLVFGLPLAAEDAPGQLATRPAVLELSLKRAVEIALSPEGSTKLQLARESFKQSEARSAQARAALLPDVEGQVVDQNQTRNLAALGLQFPTLPGFRIPTVVGPFDVFDVRASVTQNIFDLSSIRRFQAAKASVGAAKSDVENAQEQVTEQVARVYLAGLRAQASVETAQANVQLSEALVKLATSQKAAGTGTGIEITRAQVQLANDRQRLLVAENERTRADLQLLKVLGLKLDTGVRLTDRLAYVPVDAAPAEKAIAQARESRPDLKAQERRESTAKLSYGAVKGERVPSIAAFADYGAIGNSASQLPTRTYGLALRIPVFDGGRRDARRAESASQLRQERIRTADLKDQIELEVRTALDSLRSADAQVKAAEEGLQLADNELAQAQRRYRAGITNSIEVTDAQTRLDRARDNHINALYNHNLSRIDLAGAMGKIDAVIDR